MDIKTVGFERIIAIRLHCISDFSECERILYAEIMGKYSNLLLTENGIILGALKTTAADENCRRLILPGRKIRFPRPAGQGKSRRRGGARRALRPSRGRSCALSLHARWPGLAPCTAEDIAAAYQGGDLAAFVRGYLFSDEISPCVLENNGNVVDFFARRHAGAIPFDTLSAAQAYFYAKKRAKNTLEGTRRNCFPPSLRQEKTGKSGSRRSPKNSAPPRTPRRCV